MNNGELHWLPSDYDEQLALGFRIISNSYKGRVQNLEIENKNIKHQTDELRQSLGLLQKKYSTLEVDMIEAMQRGNQMAEENKKLVGTVRRLQRQIDKLEGLKRAVLSSIQDGDKDEDTIYLNPTEYIKGTAPLTISEMTDGMHPKSPATTQADHFPLVGSGDDGPAKDGKLFFRAARQALSYEDFNRFLSQIRKLNKGEMDANMILTSAQNLLGRNNPDLYEQFLELMKVHQNSQIVL